MEITFYTEIRYSTFYLSAQDIHIYPQYFDLSAVFLFIRTVQVTSVVSGVSR